MSRLDFNRNRARLAWILRLSILLLFYSCGNSKQLVVPSKEQLPNEHPRLLFLNYQVNKTRDSSISIKLINKIVTDGTLKKKPTYTSPQEGDFECLQLNEKKEVLQRMYIEDPFHPTVEFLNDDKEYESRKLDLDSAQISVKLQLNKATKFVTLQRIQETKEAKTTYTTQIDQP